MCKESDNGNINQQCKNMLANFGITTGDRVLRNKNKLNPILDHLCFSFTQFLNIFTKDQIFLDF